MSQPIFSTDRKLKPYELEEVCEDRRWYLQDEVGDALAAGQVDDLVEGDAGSLDARFPAFLAPKLRLVHYR
jgi:hypothetical protein